MSAKANRYGIYEDECLKRDGLNTGRVYRCQDKIWRYQKLYMGRYEIGVEKVTCPYVIVALYHFHANYMYEKLTWEGYGIGICMVCLYTRAVIIVR